jgi:nucleoside phosphorylase
VTTSCTAFFFATPSEARGLKKQLLLRSRTLLGPSVFYWGHPRSSPEENLLIVETGIGPKLAERAARYAFSYFKIDSAILLGVAAATHHELRVGESILASEMGSSFQNREDWLKPDSSLRQKIKELLKKCDLPFREGPILTVDHVVRSSEEKMQQGSEFGALALEMEGAFIAREAQVHSVPFVQVRWILDPVDSPLPPVEGWINERGETRWGGLMKAVVKRPKLIWELPPLAVHAQQALKPLNQFLQKWFAESP